MPTKKKSFLPVVTKAQFDKMTPGKKRMTIAEDVISQVKSRRLLAKTGYWGYATFEPQIDEDGCLIDNPEMSLQALLITPAVKKCHACGLGSAFLSVIRLHNEFDINDSEAKRGYYDIDRNQELQFAIIIEFFGIRNVHLIETAFECRWGGIDFRVNKPYEDEDEHPTEEQIDAAVRFGKKFRSHNNRLIAIMQNIIDHRGDFKPWEGWWKVW
jgi:hypothetical protein